MTYLELYNKCIERLKTEQIPDCETDVRLMFEYLLDVNRNFFLMHGGENIPISDEEKILDAVSKRADRIPLQHITGKQNFMGFEFDVTPDVLIPRFDTECLVEEAMIVCNDGDKVLDVCTGSGCILISLMNYKNNIQGFGCDISETAIDVARLNAENLCKPENTKPVFVKSDLFDSITEKDFDIIVSNPPYIRSEVIPTLMPEVKDHDPILALDGGVDGLDFYRKIVTQAMDFLKPSGRLLVEIGHDQGEEVSKLFDMAGYTDVRVIKDLAGNNRVVVGRNDIRN